MKKLKSLKELNIIRGKMMVGAATAEEQRDFLIYIYYQKIEEYLWSILK